MNAWGIKRAAALPIWQERIKECRSSGQSVKAWCQENQISVKTYYRWEKLSLAMAANEPGADVLPLRKVDSLIRIEPSLLPSGRDESASSISTASAELVIRCGCVSMDISPQMPVSRIAELVSALNSHV